MTALRYIDHNLNFIYYCYSYCEYTHVEEHFSSSLSSHKDVEAVTPNTTLKCTSLHPATTSIICNYRSSTRAYLASFPAFQIGNGPENKAIGCIFISQNLYIVYTAMVINLEASWWGYTHMHPLTMGTTNSILGSFLSINFKAPHSPPVWTSVCMYPMHGFCRH